MNKNEWTQIDGERSQIDFKYLQGKLQVIIINEKILLTYLLILLERKYLQQRMFYFYISSENSFRFISTKKYMWGRGIVLLWLDWQNFVQRTQKWHQTLYTLININNWQRLKGQLLLRLFIGSSFWCYKLMKKYQQSNEF